MARAEKGLFRDLSLKELRGVAGRKRFFPWLALNSPSVVYDEDDFTGRTILAGESTVEDVTILNRYDAISNGTSAAKAAIDTWSTGIVNGQAVLVTGTDNAGYSGLAVGLHYRADLSPFVIARVLIKSSVANTKFEIGFSDTTTRAGAVNSKANSTYTASDAAVLIYDTADNTSVEGRSVAATVAGPNITTAAPWVVGGGGFTPVADVFNYYGVFLTSYATAGTEDIGMYKIAVWNADFKLLHESAWMGAAIATPRTPLAAVTPTTLLTPWVFVQARSGAASRSLALDWWGYGQLRTTGS